MTLSLEDKNKLSLLSRVHHVIEQALERLKPFSDPEAAFQIVILSTTALTRETVSSARTTLSNASLMHPGAGSSMSFQTPVFTLFEILHSPEPF